MAIKTIFKDRAGEGVENNLADIILDAPNGGVTDAVIEELTNRTIDRYSDKIGALLRRGGIDIEDGERLTPERLGQIFEEQSGIAVNTIGDLNPDAVVAAIDKEASDRLSEALGFDVGSVFDGDALAAAIQAGLQEKIESMLDDELEKYLPAATLRMLRRRATWQRSGLDPKTVQNALAQRTWRESNRWVYS